MKTTTSHRVLSAIVIATLSTTSCKLIAQAAAPAPAPAAAIVAPPTTAISNSVAVATATANLPGSHPAIKVTRSGIITPLAPPNADGSPTMSEPTRALLSQRLTGEATQAVAITAIYPDQIAAEAKDKRCDYVLESTISQKKPKGMLSGKKMMLLQGASMLIPMAGMVGNMGTVIGTAAAGQALGEAGNLGGFMHSKTSYTLDYKLSLPGGASPVLATSETVKAQKEGDDVFSPLLKHAADAIAKQVKSSPTAK